jgi:hypothetical protein
LKKIDVVTPKISELSRYFVVPIRKEEINLKEEGRLVRLISLE